MLDEVIDYLKQLQAQVQVMSRMSSMMMPMAMPQLQMSAVMAQMAQMAHMAQGMMNMGSLAPPAAAAYAGLTPLIMPPFVPAMPPWDPAAFLACQAQQSGQVRTPTVSISTCVPRTCRRYLRGQGWLLTRTDLLQQQQPSGMEAYSKMVALYQKMSQQQQGQPSSSSKQ